MKHSSPFPKSIICFFTSLLFKLCILGGILFQEAILNPTQQGRQKFHHQVPLKHLQFPSACAMILCKSSTATEFSCELTKQVAGTIITCFFGLKILYELAIVDCRYLFCKTIIEQLCDSLIWYTWLVMQDKLKKICPQEKNKICQLQREKQGIYRKK